MVNQYLDHSREILSSNRSRFKFNERRGLGRIYLFGCQNRYDLANGFPLLTTKKVHFKSIAHELIWFLRGETNIKYLVDNGVSIWNDDAFNYNLSGMVREGVFSSEYKKFSSEWQAAKKEYVQRIKEDPDFADRWGKLGPVYGAQWLHWPKFSPIKIDVNGEEREFYVKDKDGINQIAEVISGMKKDPTSARHIISAWNPEEVPIMALPPCHTFFQLNSDGKILDLQLYQRACDMFLGVPFNIASYSLLTKILARETGLQAGDFVHTFGDVHFYAGAGERAKWYGTNLDRLKWMVQHANTSADYKSILNVLSDELPQEDAGREGMDHVTGILEQLQRKPKSLPQVKIADKPYNKLTIDDFVLEGYEDVHPTIRRTLAV